ncbi:MAG TPA: helix-turn-helix domain-containing protein, partial [Planctomycetaceae bacterium]|nr:helix-turn-helix domain-containing protein [Planctomycetaceae bacterium]
RVKQLEGMFDVPPSETSRREWSFELPLKARPWQIGLIVGPSGSGKSTLARKLWPEQLAATYAWPADKSLLDGFPIEMSVTEITELLSSVGFSSPPSWLRPFHALSNGEQFRVTLARTLAEQRDLAVVDEFTSVVDRTVAQIGSHAVAKAVRRRGGKFVAVGCHYDVIDWLDPDWVFDLQEQRFHWRSERGRPAIVLDVQRVHRRAWSLFSQHHYLTSELSPSATCFLASIQGRPVAFSAVLAFPHPIRPGLRAHRTVCLPDFQGAGIGSKFSEFVASLYRLQGKRFYTTSGHPAVIGHRQRSPLWNMIRAPSLVQPPGRKENRVKRTSCDRITAGFEYIGPPASQADFDALLTNRPDVYVPSAGGEKVLEVLRRQPGLRASDLARAAGVTTSVADRVLSELVRLGSVERQRGLSRRDAARYVFLGEPVLQQ